MAMDKEDAKGAAAALDKIGKYTRSDKEDENSITRNWYLHPLNLQMMSHYWRGSNR